MNAMLTYLEISIIAHPEYNRNDDIENLHAIKRRMLGLVVENGFGAVIMLG